MANETENGPSGGFGDNYGSGMGEPNANTGSFDSDPQGNTIDAMAGSNPGTMGFVDPGPTTATAYDWGVTTTTAAFGVASATFGVMGNWGGMIAAAAQATNQAMANAHSLEAVGHDIIGTMGAAQINGSMVGAPGPGLYDTAAQPTTSIGGAGYGDVTSLDPYASQLVYASPGGE